MKGATILAATDFSDAAGQAVERAAIIAEKIGAGRLELVNAVNIRSLKMLRRLLASEAESVETSLIDEATSALQRCTVELPTSVSIQVTSFVAVGDPADEIVARANALNSTLIVVGGRGASAVRDLLLGTTARNVIRETNRNVLVVKQPAKAPYRNVLAATDFSQHSLAAIQAARAIAPDATVTVIHAFEAPFEGKLQHAGVSREAINRCRNQAQREVEKTARGFAERADLDEPCIVVHGHPVRVIREYAERIHPDLISVGKHGQSAIEELLIGSVSEHVLVNAGCDVLVSGKKVRSNVT